MKLGIDVSTYFEEIDNGAKYYKNNKEIDPLKEFINNNVKSMRIRVWVDPYSIDGKKYLGGTCDLDNFLRLARLAKTYGYTIYLDLHYSDFWADPGKQTKPKAWDNLNTIELEKKVYDYTKEVLLRIKCENIDLDMIQVGNEITNGMLWPNGKLIENGDNERTNYETLSKFLKAGFRACKEIFPNALRMIHLEKSYDKKIYTEYFSNMEKYGVEYDVIGASYYPYWHGTMEELFDNLNTQKKLFNKKIVIAELGYAFTLENYILTNNGMEHKLVVGEDNIESFQMVKEFPLTKKGQSDFIEKFLKKALEFDVYAIYYWEPLWIPGEGICWASVEGEEYIHEENKPTANEWSNQCLFDYNGNMNPSFNKYTLKERNKDENI